MGTVYRCHDRKDNVECAVKELVPPSGKAAQERVAQFHDEARLLSSLSHPNLPRVYGFFEENERHYLVMEMIAGVTMRYWVETHGRVPQAIVTGWLDSILDVLGYLHGQQPPVIFRDVSPDNVMVNQSDLHLIDFGLARLLVPDTRTRPALRGWGSPNFAAPEHYTQGGTCPATDLYGVAAMAFWLFASEAPPEAVQRLVAPSDNAMFALLDKHVRRPLVEWVRRGMALEAARRFSSAKEMRTALKRAMSTDTVSDDKTAGPVVWAVFVESLRHRVHATGWSIERRVTEPFSLVASRRVGLGLHHGFCWLRDPLDKEAIDRAAILARQQALCRRSVLPSTLYFTIGGTQVPNPEAVTAAAAKPIPETWLRTPNSGGLSTIILLPVDLQRGLALDAHVPPRFRNTNDPGDFILNVRIAIGGGTAPL